MNEPRPALDTVKLKALYQRAAWRYDRQHRLLTLASDQRGRELVVRHTVRPGDRVLDAGCGTGATARLAAQAAGPTGFVAGLDLTPDMLELARRKTVAGGATPVLAIGDMTALPFVGESFDCVLSSYSVCPLSDPERGALELYRVVAPGRPPRHRPFGRAAKSLAAKTGGQPGEIAVAAAPTLSRLPPGRRAAGAAPGRCPDRPRPLDRPAAVAVSCHRSGQTGSFCRVIPGKHKPG